MKRQSRVIGEDPEEEARAEEEDRKTEESVARAGGIHSPTAVAEEEEEEVRSSAGAITSGTYVILVLYMLFNCMKLFCSSSYLFNLI